MHKCDRAQVLPAQLKIELGLLCIGEGRQVAVIVIYCSGLCYPVLYYIILWYTELHYTILYYTVVCCILLNYTVLYLITLYYTIMYRVIRCHYR